MKKKLFLACVIGAGIIVICVIVLSFAVKSYLKSEKLKALIVPRVEELTGRKAGIDLIKVSLFRGIVVKGISLMEPDGKQEFITMKEFVLEYDLVPLLQKKLVIKRVELVSPYIRLVREKSGRFNFSDILEKSKDEKAGGPSGSAGEGGLPLSVDIRNVSLRDAKVTFADEQGDLPAADILSDSDLKLSQERGKAAPGLSGKINIRDMALKGDGGEVKGSGTISMGPDAIEFSINAAIGKDTVKLSGDVKDYRARPIARADINAPELDVEKLMAVSAGKKAAAKPESVKRSAPAQKDRRKAGEKVKEKTKGKTGGMSASGGVKIGAVKYKGYVLKDFVAAYKYSEGNIVVNPVSAGISGEKGITLQGTAKGELAGSTTLGESAGDSLKRSLKGKFTADMSRCEIKESKIGGAIALFTGIKELASPKFDTVHFIFTIGNEKILLNGNMASSLITLNPSGTVGFDTKMDVAADIRVAPAVAGSLVTGSFMRYVKDEKGWTVIPLRITGTTDKPSVGLNQAAIGKQIQKGATQEMEKRLFKGIFGR